MIDEINHEIDKRKIEKLVDDGVITDDELQNARIVIECPNCKSDQDVSSNFCKECGERFI